VTATPGSVIFNAGDQQAAFNLRGLAPGSTSISLGTAPGYQIPNARSSVEIRVARSAAVLHKHVYDERWLVGFGPVAAKSLTLFHFGAGLELL